LEVSSKLSGAVLSEELMSILTLDWESVMSEVYLGRGFKRKEEFLALLRKWYHSDLKSFS